MIKSWNFNCNPLYWFLLTCATQELTRKIRTHGTRIRLCVRRVKLAAVGMLKEYIFCSIEWFLRVQHLLSLTCFRSGHLIVVVFPSIKIYSLLILLLGHIRFQKFAKTASVIMYMECKSLLLNSLSTLPLHTIH